MVIARLSDPLDADARGLAACRRVRPADDLPRAGLVGQAVADPGLGIGRTRIAAQWRFGSTDLRDLLVDHSRPSAAAFRISAAQAGHIPWDVHESNFR